MSEKRSADVVIPNLNGCALLRECLTKLRQQNVEHGVIVVDNASSDDSQEMVASEFPEVTLIKQESNLGYGAAVNIGVAAARAEAVVVINNDVFCEPSFIREITAPLDSKSRVGMVAGLLLQPQKELIDSFGIELDRTLAAFNRLRLSQRQLASNTFATPFLGPNGGAAAYLREAFEQAGGFDPHLFAYCEDVDLNLRLRAAGWAAALAAGAVATHIGGATAGLGSAWQLELYSFGRWFTMRRYRILRPSFNGLYAFAVEMLLLIVKSISRRRLAILKAAWRGFRAAKGEKFEFPAEVVNLEIGLRERLRRLRLQ